MQTQRRRKFWMFLATLPLFATGCYYDNEELLYPGSQIDCTTVTAHFTDAQHVILTKCATAGCHNASAAGGVTLETYDEIRVKADRINQRVIIEKTMPPGSPLSPAEIAILKCWISSGMPNN